MNGIVLLNKPSDFTSFDAVAKMRGILKFRKVGHGGTLDPMAQGVLPILLGPATRVCDIVPESSKRYRAVMRLGISTDTQDITGNIVKTASVTVGEKEVREILPRFTGNILQTPPMYSAVQVGGKRLYDLARKGIDVERPARSIEILSLELVKALPQKNEYILDVACSKGSYIRTLCSDIGDALGCGATLTALTRTEAFGFSLADCFTFADFEKMAAEGTLERAVISVDSLFLSSPAYFLSDADARLHINGVPIYASRLSALPDTDDFIRIYGYGKFLSLSKLDREAGQLKVVKFFFTRD